jgi:hypothetical protein
LSFSEEKEYDDQIVIVDGIGITHFIPRRPSAEKAAPPKMEKRKGRGRRAKGRRPRSR